MLLAHACHKHSIYVDYLKLALYHNYVNRKDRSAILNTIILTIHII